MLFLKQQCEKWRPVRVTWTLTSVHVPQNKVCVSSSSWCVSVLTEQTQQTCFLHPRMMRLLTVVSHSERSSLQQMWVWSCWADWMMIFSMKAGSSCSWQQEAASVPACLSLSDSLTLFQPLKCGQEEAEIQRVSARCQPAHQCETRWCPHCTWTQNSQQHSFYVTLQNVSVNHDIQ